MSPAAVTVVAWLALAGVVLLGIVLVLLLRRTRALYRANTDRKWDVVHLRAELGALRGRDPAGTDDGDLEDGDTGGEDTGDGDVDDAVGFAGVPTGPDADTDTDEPGADEADEADEAGDRSGLRRTASPPAWRRDHGRTRAGRPRRRRPA